MIRKFGWTGEFDSNLHQQIRDVAEKAKVGIIRIATETESGIQLGDTHF